MSPTFFEDLSVTLFKIYWQLRWEHVGDFVENRFVILMETFESMLATFLKICWQLCWKHVDNWKWKRVGRFFENISLIVKNICEYCHRNVSYRRKLFFFCQKKFFLTCGDDEKSRRLRFLRFLTIWKWVKIWKKA